MFFRRTLLLGALVAAPAARAQPADAAMRAAIRRAVAGHVLPRHAAFAQAAAGFGQATQAIAAPDEARAAWVAAALAFQGIRHLRFGPMEAFDRGFRIAFFPDPRNAIGREMAELLRGDDPAALSAESFARGRIAGQGLPAAERLLFGEDAPRLLAPDQGSRRTLLAAIGRNIAALGAEMNQAWTTADPPYGTRLEGDGGSYAGPQDGLLTLFKSLHGGLEFLAEREVARPLGASLREAAPRRAEAWRSGQSLALARASLAAQQELWLTCFAPLVPAPLGRQVEAGFTAATRAGEAIAPSLEDAVTKPAGRAAVEAMVREIGALRRLLTERAAPALGLPVGFNSMDGD